MTTPPTTTSRRRKAPPTPGPQTLPPLPVPGDARAASERAVWAVEDLLQALGQDVTREGLRETPARVARMYAELLTPAPFTFTTFAAEGADQLIIERDIAFYSLCEHHLLPFTGVAHVGYIPRPDGRIVGLSKLARVVRHFASALQTQERLTGQIADFLDTHLAQPVGVGVVLEARHLCMEMRGVRAPGVMTTTSALRGALLHEADARAEFLALAHARWSGQGGGGR